MSGSIKEFSTYTLESPLVKIGTYRDSKGEEFNVTKERLKTMYDKITSTKDIKERHVYDGSDGNPIASIQKYVLRDDGIYQKSVVTDSTKFENRYKNGSIFISPEISDDYEIVGAAMTPNPGMVKDKVDVNIHYFEAEVGSENISTTTESPWQEPLGELKNTISNLNNTLTSFGEQVKNMSPPIEPKIVTEQPAQSNANNNAATLTLSVDDLAKYVNDAVEKRLKEQQIPTKTPEASETIVNKPVESQILGKESNQDEITKQYAELLNKTRNLEESQEKAYKKQFNAIVGELKAIGIEHPEKMAPDSLNTEQRITILESVKENFARNSSLSTPLQESLSSSGGGTGGKKSAVTMNDVLNAFDSIFGINDSSGNTMNDPAMRTKLNQLSDSKLMSKYNMLQLYDANGNYIGPV